MKWLKELEGNGWCVGRRVQGWLTWNEWSDWKNWKRMDGVVAETVWGDEWTNDWRDERVSGKNLVGMRDLGTIRICIFLFLFLCFPFFFFFLLTWAADTKAWLEGNFKSPVTSRSRSRPKLKHGRNGKRWAVSLHPCSCPPSSEWVPDVSQRSWPAFWGGDLAPASARCARVPIQRLYSRSPTRKHERCICGM